MSLRQQNPSDPTDERTAEQSTPSASGVSAGRGPELPNEQEADDVLNRNTEERYDTPRRYEGEDSSSPRPSESDGR